MASILAVDDSITMRQMLSIALRADGHEVIAVEDAAGALELARERRFDIVFTDLRMPRMDGIELITELRRLPGCSGAPIFVLTTESAAAPRQAAQRAGASGWIVKPVAAEALRGLVAEALCRIR